MAAETDGPEAAALERHMSECSSANDSDSSALFGNETPREPTAVESLVRLDRLASDLYAAFHEAVGHPPVLTPKLGGSLVTTDCLIIQRGEAERLLRRLRKP